VTGQVVLPPIRRKVLGDQLYARLKALPGPTPVTVYRGEVDDHPPLALDAAGQADPSGRVAPYVVLFDGTGTPDLEPDLAGRNEDLRWSPQITVAAGWSPDCTQLVDQVCAWVYRWAPVLEGASAGGLEPPPGFDPGPPRADRTVTPVRFFVPLQWQLDVTT
jgi:hypothetical protein